MSKVKIVVVFILVVSGLVGGQQVGEAEADPPPKTKDKTKIRSDRYGDPLPEGAIARLGTVRFRNGEPLYSLVFSPDGKMLASVGENDVCVWDATTGRRLRRFTTTDTLLRFYADDIFVVFSPDSKTLACAGWGGTILWNVANGKVEKEFQTPREQVQGPIGGGFGGFWTSPHGFTLSPDLKTLAFIHGDRKTIRIWDVKAGKEIGKLTASKALVASLAFSKDGKVLAGLQGTAMGFWDVASQKLIREWDAPAVNLPFGYPGKAATDGKIVALGYRESVIGLRDAVTGKELRQLKGPKKGNISSEPMVFSNDGTKLASGGYQDWLRLWDVASGKQLQQLPSGGRAAFSPDGKILASGHGVTIRLWDMASGKELGSPAGLINAAQTLAFSNGGHSLTPYCWGEVTRWDVAEAREIGSIQLVWKRSSVLSPDFKIFARELPETGAIELYHPGTGQELRRLTGHPKNTIKSMVFSRDGRMLASAARDFTLRLWEVASGKELRCVSFHNEIPVHLAFSPDGKFLVFSHGDPYRKGTWCFLDLARGCQRPVFEGSLSGSYAQSFSPDSKLFACVEGGEKLSLWEVATGKLVLKIDGEFDYDTFIALSPINTILATSKSGSIDLWDARTGKGAGKLPGHESSVKSGLFSGDGKVLATGSSDTTVLLWDVSRWTSQDKLASVKLEPKHLEELWSHLSGDAPGAYRAIWTLVSGPKETVPFLQQHVFPAKEDAKRTAQLIADLDHDRFAVREKATKELGALGGLVEPALRASLAGKPSLEVRTRIAKLLDQMESEVPVADELRNLRAVVVLEHIGTPEAKGLLQALSRGASHARLTQEAKASLERLAQADENKR